jgi:Zn-dependent protease
MKLNNIYNPSGNLNGNLNVMREVGSTDSFIMIFAMLNMALFIVNIIPLPGLDGGKVIEVTARKVLISMGLKESTMDKIMKPLYAASFVILISPFIVNEILGIEEKGFSLVYSREEMKNTKRTLV